MEQRAGGVFTARFARVAEDAKRKVFVIAVDPGGIGSAFHRAE